MHLAVMWAVKNGIATGVDAERFEPHSGCTRGEVVTFLWRALGSPAVKAEHSPFIDVKETDYCFKPSMWAVENKIGTAISERIFAANASCSRAQFVTFLHRALGSPAPNKRESGFADVTETDFFYDAVLWAVEQGITSGVGEGIFGPYTLCNRDQVIVFLYRYFHK